MSNFTFGPFNTSFNVNQGLITVSKDGEVLTFYTGEGDMAKQAVSTAASFFDIPVMPEFVHFGPLRLHFMSDGRTRLEKLEGGVSFDRSNCDDLVVAIDRTVQACSDQLRLTGGARPGGRMPGSPDPII